MVILWYFEIYHDAEMFYTMVLSKYHGSTMVLTFMHYSFLCDNKEQKNTIVQLWYMSKIVNSSATIL